MKKIIYSKKILSIVSSFVVSLSVYGANVRCYGAFHEVKKDKALDRLKKY